MLGIFDLTVNNSAAISPFLWIASQVLSWHIVPGSECERFEEDFIFFSSCEEDVFTTTIAWQRSGTNLRSLLSLSAHLTTSFQREAEEDTRKQFAFFSLPD